MNNGRLVHTSCSIALLAVSCTQPQFLDVDGGTPTADSAPDSPYQPPAGFDTALPSWAEAMPGPYMFAGYAFSTFSSSVGVFASRRRSVGFAEISVDRDGVWLRSSFCESLSETNGIGLVMRVESPEKIQIAKNRLMFSINGESWMGEPESPKFFGAVSEAPPECKGHEGQRIPRVAEQTWLAPDDECFCDFDEDVSRLDDCRIRDGDGDGEPGVKTLIETTSGFGRVFEGFTNSLAQDALACGDSFNAAERHDGRWVQGTPPGDDGSLQVFLELGGHPVGLHEAASACNDNLKAADACPPSHNKFQLLRRPDHIATCDDLLDANPFDDPPEFEGSVCPTGR